MDNSILTDRGGVVMDQMTTTVTLPGPVFWKLAALAEAHEMRADQYMVELAYQATLRRDSDGLDSVAVRWRRGWTDKRIAADLGWTNLQVASRRRSLGLSANKQTKESKPS